MLGRNEYQFNQIKFSREYHRAATNKDHNYASWIKKKKRTLVETSYELDRCFYYYYRYTVKHESWRLIALILEGEKRVGLLLVNRKFRVWF